LRKYIIVITTISIKRPLCIHVLLAATLIYGATLSVFAQSEQRGLPLVHNFTTEDYQAGIQNWDLYQDPLGLLYVANNFGVLIFDGEHWKKISLEGNTRTRAVYVSEDQRIYLGGQGNFGYLETVAADSFQFVSLKNQLPEIHQNFDEVWKVYPVGEEVVFCTLDYLFVYNGESLRVIDPKISIQFSFLVNDELYVGSDKKGLLKLGENGLRPVPQGDAFAGMEIRGIEPFDKDRLLVATRDNGFFLLSAFSVVPWHTPFTDQLLKPQINAFRMLRNGQFAVGTQANGLVVLSHDGALLHFLNKERGLTNGTVLSLYEDRLGNLWAGLNNGIAYVEIDRPFTQINNNLGLLGTGYTAANFEGSLYLGTSGGLFVRETASAGEFGSNGFTLVSGSEGQVYNLQVIDGRLFMAHHKGGFLVQGNRAERMSGFDGAWKFMPIPNSNKVLVGTYDGMVLLQKKDGRWVFSKRLNGFGESSRKFEMDGRGQVWISHGYKGVYRLTFNTAYDSLQQVQFYGEEQGFPSNLLINVFKIGGDLVFAAEEGIYRYHDAEDRFVRDESLSAYFGQDHIRELEEDLLGNIYFITDYEVGVLQKLPHGEFRKETDGFTKINRFISDDLENITVIDQRNVLFDAKEGFIHMDSEQGELPQLAFRALIRSIKWNEQELFQGFYAQGEAADLNKNLMLAPPELPFGKNSLHFQFSTPFYEGMRFNQYRYLLKGFDVDWSDWDKDTEKEYTNLSEGDYTFLVKARNIYGQESGTMQFSFTVLPPWYRTRLAYSCYVMVFVVLIGSALSMLDRKYRKKQQVIEKNAQAAIGEKDAALKAVTKQSEQEITKLQNERLALELQHKNSELASTAMHLINKNEFMNALKSSIKELLKETKGQGKTERGLQRLVKDIERNIAEDEVWGRFELHFDQVHGDFIKKLKGKFPALTPQEVKLAAFLRMNMSTKEIANLLNISVRGVEISRYRLRKKLPIERNDNLVEYMMSL